MAGFMYPGLLSDWTDGMDPQDPNAMPQGLLAALSQAQGGAPMGNSPQMGGASPMLGSGGFTAPMSQAAPRPAPQAYDDPFAGDPRFNQQPAPVNGQPMPAIPSASNPIPQFQAQPDNGQSGFLEGSPAYQAYADRPSPGATPAGGAPMQPGQGGKDQPGFLEKLTGALGGVYGQGGPGDGLINLGLALMSPGNKAENLMKAGQMGQMNDYRKSQLQAAQMKQMREQQALLGNMKTLKDAYPNWTPEQLMAGAQSADIVKGAVQRLNPNEQYKLETAENGDVFQRNTVNDQRTLVKGAPESHYGVVGNDKFGRPQYGWTNSRSMSVQPSAGQQPATAGPVTVQGPNGPVEVPDGQDPKVYLETISKRGADAAAGPKFDEVSGLRKEVQSLPSYKNIAQAAPIYRSMAKTAGTDSKASDLNLVYGLGKIMDPGSVVREGEMIMVKNTASLPDWLVGAANSLNGGQALLPETRQAILKEAHNRVTSYQDEFSRDTEHYRGISGRNKMNPDDIIPSFGEFQPWDGSKSPTAPAANNDGWTVVNGHRVRKVN